MRFQLLCLLICKRNRNPKPTLCVLLSLIRYDNNLDYSNLFPEQHSFLFFLFPCHLLGDSSYLLVGNTNSALILSSSIRLASLHFPLHSPPLKSSPLIIFPFHLPPLYSSILHSSTLQLSSLHSIFACSLVFVSQCPSPSWHFFHSFKSSLFLLFSLVYTFFLQETSL